tara:strand:- start:247 stop:591 length:345 start_codon:yes stop_codon:yes gene_type:complete
MSGKKYFPNNWQQYKDAPDDMFMNHTFDEIMNYKIGGWQLPSSVNCIIREEHIITGKVKEYVYQRSHAAESKVKQLLQRDDIEFTVCTPDQIHFVSQLTTDDDYEDDNDEQKDS